LTLALDENECSASLSSALPLGKESPVTIKKGGLDGQQIWSGDSGEEKSLVLAENQTPDLPDHILFNTVTELFRLPSQSVFFTKC
jgi:hypothetical protein